MLTSDPSAQTMLSPDCGEMITSPPLFILFMVPGNTLYYAFIFNLISRTNSVSFEPANAYTVLGHKAQAAEKRKKPHVHEVSLSWGESGTAVWHVSA